jgi:hypothetical protein
VRAAGIALATGLALALAGLLMAAGTGSPYLTGGDVNAWIVVFAVGLFTALFAAPFLIEHTLRASRGEEEARWDYALPLWGGIALAILAVSLLVGIGTDFAGDSLAGSAALIAVIEAGLVILTLIVTALAG